MKKILFIIFVLTIFLVYGCGKDPETILEPITADVVEVEYIEIVEEDVIDEEKEDIKTVRLCHDTDKGIIRWAGGTVFGFYDNAERFEFDDYCFDNNILIEYYCEDEIPQNRTFICKSGCEDSHCI